VYDPTAPPEEETPAEAGEIEVSEEQPLEGEVVEDDIPFGDASEPSTAEPTFEVGKHAGVPLEDILALGDEGRSYLYWGYKNWKQEPLRSALNRFAELHPEIKTKP
jgi:hypothetical protein